MRGSGCRVLSVWGPVAVLFGFTDTAAAQVAEADEVDQRQPAAEYPTAYIERPLTLPASMAEVVLRHGYRWIEDDENTSTTTVRANFGATEWWQASAWTRWRVAPDREWGETVGIATRVRAIDTGRFDLAPGLSVPVVFDGDRDTAPVPWVTVDANCRIRIFRRSAVYIGHDLATFGLGNSFVSIDLHAGYVTQFSRHLGLQIWAQLVHIRVAGDIGESGGPYLPGATLFLSPASWLDVWIAGHTTSRSDGLSVGVAGRL
jgi:hypothetical protein